MLCVLCQLPHSCRLNNNTQNTSTAASKALGETATSVSNATYSKDDFTEFLRKLLNGRTTDWKTAKTAQDALIRHNTVVEAIDYLDGLGWAKTGGGFQVPDSAKS